MSRVLFSRVDPDGLALPDGSIFAVGGKEIEVQP